MRRRVILGIASGAAVLALAGAGRWAWNDYGPRIDSGGGWMVAALQSRANSPYTYGIPICVDKPGSVTVERVTLYGSSGFRVGAFAVLPTWNQTLGAEPGTLAQHGYRPDGPRTISAVCKQDGGDNMLGLEIERTAAVGAAAQALEVTYRSEGIRHTARLGYGVGLCVPHDPATPWAAPTVVADACHSGE